MDVTVLHKGTVRNGIIVYDYPKLYSGKLKSLEGKRVDVSLELEHEPVTKYQWAYYFGGIIKGTCMKSTAFAGWTYDEIHQAIVAHLRTNTKVVVFPDGSENILRYVDDLKQYSVGQMAVYIEDVLNFLAEKDIHPLPPDHYKYGVNLQIKNKNDGNTI
jgi:hypothetical protein